MKLAATPGWRLADELPWLLTATLRSGLMKGQHEWVHYSHYVFAEADFDYLELNGIVRMVCLSTKAITYVMLSSVRPSHPTITKPQFPLSAREPSRTYLCSSNSILK